MIWNFHDKFICFRCNIYVNKFLNSSSKSAASVANGCRRSYKNGVRWCRRFCDARKSHWSAGTQAGFATPSAPSVSGTPAPISWISGAGNVIFYIVHFSHGFYLLYLCFFYCRFKIWYWNLCKMENVLKLWKNILVMIGIGKFLACFWNISMFCIFEQRS